MKRLCFLLIMTVFVNIWVNAQIQRRFFNFNLGTSTKNEVISYFKSKGHKIEKQKDNNDNYVVKHVTFGGHTWPYTVYTFYKGKLYVVYFSDSEDFTSTQTLDLVWNNINKKISDKYYKYYNSSSSNDNTKEYQDVRTRISLSYDYFGGRRSLTLLYIDRRINSQKYEDSIDEL